MKRGEVWWASLPAPTGSGPGLRRPVLLVQANPFNESRLPTVIVAVITSNLARAEAPGNVRVARADSGLQRTSVVNVSQLFTIDRDVLTKRVRALPSLVMQSVDDELKLVLALG
jgi:mRNA interferase MazF